VPQKKFKIMIVCEDKKFVFIKNPKTASRSLSSFFINNFKCFNLGLDHSINIPSQYKDFTIYLTIRNPLSRAVSAWKHVVKDWKIKNLGDGDLSLKQYLKYRMFSTGDGFNFFYQSHLLNQFNRNIVKIIYFEKVQTQVQMYFGKSNLSFEGRSEGLDWNYYYRHKKIQQIAFDSLEKDINMFKCYKKFF
jgi:hypothetical protein